MHRLYEQRRSYALPFGAGAAELDHVRGDVAPVDVETITQPGQQEAAGATGDVESWLPIRLDESPVVVDLRAPRG
jgi:hypothetical protein